MAQNIILLYQNLFKQLTALQVQERELSEKLRSLQAAASAAASQLKPELDQRIQKIDADLRRIDLYLTGARDYAALTQYTPVAENVHFASLQQLYTMMSNSSSGRQNALLLLKKASNAKKYWENEKKRVLDECARKSASLMNNAKSGPEALSVSNSLSAVRKAIADLPGSSEMRLLATEINNRSSRFFIKNNTTYNPAVPQKTGEVLCFGFVLFPFPMGKAYEKELKSTLGNFFNEADQTIKVPLSFPSEAIGKNGAYSATKLAVTYNDQTYVKSHKIMQGLLFNILRSYAPLRNRVLYLDLETYNPENLGAMKHFAGRDSLIHFPTNSTSAAAAIRQLETEALEEQETVRHRRYLIIRGYYSGSADVKIGETLRKICNDTRRNNISVIFIDKEPNSKTAAYGNTIAVNTRIVSKGDCFYTDRWGEEMRFGWLAPPAAITSEAISRFAAAYQPKKIRNEYEHFFKLNAQATYTRDRKPITVPYGINSKGKILNLTLEGMRFASFVMGAAGSGKSTLIHAIIAGILQNYHPDEVELWLADFKMVEFSPYVRHMPPHVKYILMDASSELIRDFIDRLEDELERRKIVISNCNRKDRRDVPVDKYLPAILVIIDEFSNLSAVIKDDEAYKGKLEKLLREGRSNGFNFIFASQAYTDGARALTSFSKKQIGSRIALKNDVEEIKQTLNLPSSQYTDAVRYAIDTLPEFYSLHHWQEKGEGQHYVDKALTLYFEGKDDKGWASRFALIDGLKKRMRPIEESQYNGRVINQYVNKHPVVISSGALQVFQPKEFAARASLYRNDPANICFDSDRLVSFGAPCKLVDNQFAVLTSEANENIFLLAGDQELPCAMSVTLSTIRSFIAQKANIQVWAAPRNRIYHTYKDSHFSRLPVSCGKDEICTAISDVVDRIRAGKQGNDLIVLLGMEQICPKLNEDSVSAFFTKPTAKTAVSLVGLRATTEQEIREAEECEQDDIILGELYDKLLEEGEALGKTEEQIDREYEIARQKYMEKKYSFSASAAAPERNSVQETPPEPARDHLKEFQMLIQAGSQYGYRFLLCVNNYNALKAMGITINNFNHRLAFKTDSADTSSAIFNTSAAYKLSEHSCYYTAFGSSSGRYNIIPYLHKGVCWDNWTVDASGAPRKAGQ